MRAHVFRGRFAPLVLDDFVRDFDVRTRTEGFHVLHSWNHREHHFTKDNTPVLLLDRFAREWSATRATPRVRALLLDHYFFYVLAVVVMRAWDEGDANANLDRVTGLLGHLQGPGGSGHQFVARAETLLLMAISHFHPDESAYPRLLEKIRTLDRAHRLRFALAEAAILGSHLRWGFAVLYRRDLGRMRADNVGDYPWLLFSVATLLEEYARPRDEEDAGGEDRRATRRARVLEGLIDGLTPDPWAFTGAPPEALRPHREEHARFRETFADHRDDLLEAFAALRPDREAYSPLSFHCNFPHNAIMAKVSIHLADENAPNLPMDSMFARADAWRPDDPEAPAEESGGASASGARKVVAVEGTSLASPTEPSQPDLETDSELGEEAAEPDGKADAEEPDPRRAHPAAFAAANHPEALARYLMAYSGASPERLGRRGARLIIYDPNVGLRHHGMALRALRADG